MHGEIGIALAVAELRIGQLAVLHAARVLLAERQRSERLGEQCEVRDAQRDLTGARLHEAALHPDVIAKIEQLDETVPVGSELVALEVELNFPRGVLEMRERRL